ncbi:cyclin-like protein [Fomitopsis serialis]|uniref:cyclin-like protein n=1 Tax=Fomitopsis serialis TaxID=139415 RepID=UPI002007D352|nr:cyclin-like protein [Neoantrodia serialis]KAH9937569.1 cyclin-like protein [Neoantrodia serialis]
MAAGPVPPPNAEASSSKHSIYEASTQYRHWRFSPEDLAQTRTALNAAAVSVIRDAFEIDETGSSADVSFLDADEECLLVKLYIGKISQLCDLFRFPEEVEATAMTYLKRFYLKNTVMDWHPKNVMLTALFLATKTTNNPIPVDTYTSRIPKTQPSDVLDLEFLVAQSLGFDFAVWHAHRALWGMSLDVQAIPETTREEVHRAYQIALNHVRASRLTDAELLFTPAQIALACLSTASPHLAVSWARLKLADQADALLSGIEPIKAMVGAHGALPNLEAVRDVDRRLKLCKNPEKVVGSRAYLKKQGEAEQKADEKRRRKAAAVRKAMEEGDPFGSELAGDGGMEDDDDDD